MIKHKSQRVGVFIDVQNMYYSAKKLYNMKVNFGEILKEAVGDRQLIRAIAYVVKATGEEQAFFDALNERGLETKEREVQVFDDGAKKADWDVGITVDAIRIGEILDVIVLVSGDGDFVEMVDYLKHHGRQVEAIAFGQTSSSKLRNVVDHFTDLSEDKDRFLIVDRRSPRGPNASVNKSSSKQTSQQPAAKIAPANNDTKPAKKRSSGRRRRPSANNTSK